MNEIRAKPVDLTIETRIADPFENLFEDHLQFEAGKVRPHAKMLADAAGMAANEIALEGLDPIGIRDVRTIIMKSSDSFFRMYHQITWFGLVSEHFVFHCR